LIERDKRTLYIRHRVEGEKDDYNEPVPGSKWGPPVTIRAACQPASGSLDAQIYGERAKTMCNIFFDGLEAVAAGDGLCIHVAPTALPDYRVVSVQGWDHQRIDAEFIPPAQRG